MRRPMPTPTPPPSQKKAYVSVPMYGQGKCQNQVFYEIVIPAAPIVVLWYLTIIPHHKKKSEQLWNSFKKPPKSQKKPTNLRTPQETGKNHSDTFKGTTGITSNLF